MEFVHDPVQHRRQQYTRRDQEHQASVQGIQSRKDLAAGSSRRFHRTHAAEQHGGVQERITPGQMLVMHVAPHADGQRYYYQAEDKQEVPQHAQQELAARQRRVATRFVHLPNQPHSTYGRIRRAILFA